MLRGIDENTFAPAQSRSEHPFTIGYVGRLSTEKNVRLLAAVERNLSAAGMSNYRFLIVGDGKERDWLATNLPSAMLPGFLVREQLSAAYQSMDVFVFPSETDTFGMR